MSLYLLLPNTIIKILNYLWHICQYYSYYFHNVLLHCHDVEPKLPNDIMDHILELNNYLSNKISSLGDSKWNTLNIAACCDNSILIQHHLLQSVDWLCCVLLVSFTYLLLWGTINPESSDSMKMILLTELFLFCHKIIVALSKQQKLFLMLPLEEKTLHSAQPASIKDEMILDVLSLEELISFEPEVLQTGNIIHDYYNLLFV